MSLRPEEEGVTGTGWKLPEELRMLADLGDAETVREVISVFQSDTEARLGRLRAAVTEHDAARVRGEAHAIKGSAGQVGAARVSNLSKEMESAALRQDLAEAERLLPQLEAEFATVRRDMQSAQIP